MHVNLPTPEQVLELHEQLVKMFKGGDDPIVPSGPVDGGALLESACARPLAGYGGVEKYPTTEAKCAALFHSLAKNHPFYNGNKRTALVALITTLYLNKRILRTDVTDDEVYDFTIAVASDLFPHPNHGLGIDDVLNQMGYWLRDCVKSPSSSDFSTCTNWRNGVESLGCRTKNRIRVI